ncbi:hypothetical protein [Candidatus Amarolinea dominans]|uniref:hypothetical protein n=1 Tax=Candidatus Amarolinea dominans TaxID=3140696 RepID=UPI0031CCC6CE
MSTAAAATATHGGKIPPPAAQAFGGMLPILFDVSQVIDEITGARDRTETDKGRHGAQEGIYAEELPIENQCGEHEAVFRPLSRPHGPEEGT